MRFLRKIFFLSTFLVLLTNFVKAQISPPGLSNTNIAIWGAVGFNQDLSPRWLWSAYYGISAMSAPDNFLFAQKQAIQVFNQEFQYKFNKNWQLSFCGSFRQQNEYEKELPYQLSSPSFRKEIRFYSRLYYKHSIHKLSFTYSFRPELRLFYQPDWVAWENPMQIRLRLKASMNIPLNSNNTNIIIIGNELLGSTSKTQSSQELVSWSKYQLSENRFTAYFRHTFQKPALNVDIGMMKQTLMNFQKNEFHQATYFSIDFIFLNPFGKSKKSMVL